MSYNSKDKKTSDFGISKGYKHSSVDPNKMITDSGKFLKRESEKRYNLNGYKYTSVTDLKNSTKW